MEKYKKQSIDRFYFLNNNQITTLKQNDISTLEQLSEQTRKNLKQYGFENLDINRIDVELQLLGMGLKQNS